MKINLPMAITAADSNKRTITGKIVTWNEKGNTSVGPTIFASNSIELKAVKLLLEHDRTRPIGKVMEFSETKDGIEATFKIANTMAGEDALVEASEGLRDGFSVGAMINEWSNDNGVMKITSASLEEVSLVTDPAIDSARVSEVAASENEAPKDSESATADADKPTEGEQVSDTTAPAPTEEAVEAAKVQSVEATRPAFYTAPRIELSKEKYLEASIRAKVFGDEASIQYVRAAADTTDNAGLVPTRQLTEVINPLANADRPSIDAISSAVLPDAGMTFEIPKLTQAPTVAETAEAGAPSDTDINTSYLSVTVKKYAGQQTFSVELLDRSSPAFFAELVRQMEFAYAKATNAAVSAAIVSGATDGGNRTLTAANLQDFIADGAVSIYKGTLGFAQNLIVSPEQWGAIMGLVDGSNRPIFTAINPQNAGGALAAGSVRGNVAGLALYVDRSLTTGSGVGDGTMLIVNPESYTWYESSRFRLETNVIASGQVNVAYYGYGAIATKVAAGAYKWMVA